MKQKFTIADAVIWIALAVAGATCLVPMLNTLAISLSDKTSAALGRVYFWPINFNMSSYAKILEEQQFFRSFGVSVLRVALGGFINIALCIVMAYPLSKDKEAFRFRDAYIWVIVFTMLFSGGLVPTFLVIKSLGLMNTLWALVLPGAVPVFSLILLMNFYKGIPKALEEAARVDGANPWYIMLMIYAPLSKPSIATIALFSIVGHWNAFFDGKIYINSPLRMPLQTYIQSLTVQVDFTRLASMTREQVLEQLERSNLTFNSAKVVVSMVPILLLYPFLQRYFVTGIVMGAVKE
ncbi:MAG: carbohydrate ABC transporter permease [Clostridiales bacterium]|jgi:ABC-type glycerol-3-phosphate transport system permease component|nr:carbohydrate ABC transporter permease [Clostridiales bacterium]